MPPRRDPSAPAPQSPEPAGPRGAGAKRGGLFRRREVAAGRPPSAWSRYDWRQRLGLIALGVLGVVGAGQLLALVWPEADKAQLPPEEITPASLADKPHRAVTVLVIGSDADSLAAPTNGAAPPGPANADALLLLRVNPKGPLQILNLPVEAAVQLPGKSAPQSLGSLYREGGVALTADVVRELTGLERPAPDRYIVLPRGALRDLVNGVGGLELNPPRTMRYQDKAMKYRIDLQGGLQELSGAQVEQMVRFRDRWLGESGRRNAHQLVATGLLKRLGGTEQLSNLPALIGGLQGKVDTNLSPRETLSLLAAGLDSTVPPTFSSLPLSPAKPGHGSLRQLAPSSGGPIWKAP